MTAGAFAQQQALSNHNYLRKSLISPAQISFDNKLDMFLASQVQRMAFDGRSVLNQAQFNGLLNSKSAYGINLLNQQEGIWRNTSLQFDYAQLYKISEANSLRLGLSAYYLGSRLDQPSIFASDDNDPLLDSDVLSGSSYGFNFGALYLMGRHRIGFSIPNIWSNTLSYLGGEVDYNLNRVFQASYATNLAINFNADLEPVVIARKNAAGPFQLDIGLLVHYKEKIKVGGFYRNSRTLGTIVSYELNDMYIFNYSYSNARNTIMQANHEFSVNMNIGNFRKKNGSNHDEIQKRLISKIYHLENGLQKSKYDLDTVKITLDSIKAARALANEKIEQLNQRISQLISEDVSLQNVAPEIKADINSHNIKAIEEFVASAEKEAENSIENEAENEVENSIENATERILKSGYAIVFESFISKERAELARDSWQKKTNLELRLIISENNQWHYVCSPKYTDLDEARYDIEKIKSELEVKGVWLFGIK